MKTIREWVKELPAEYHVSILSQSSLLDVKSPNLKESLYGFEAWINTVENYKFWCNLIWILEDGKYIPPYKSHLKNYKTDKNDMESIAAMQGWTDAELKELEGER